MPQERGLPPRGGKIDGGALLIKMQVQKGFFFVSALN
jgi:hypothetical protein